ncbi:hypothetical protein LguiB_009054 [Lonicera macranthoides]
MDQPDHTQQQTRSEVITGARQMAAYSPYLAAPMVAAGTPPSAEVSSSQHQLPFHHHQLQSFWANQMQEMEQTIDFKNHSLPLARIKKIMKADEDVRMISAEAPVIFAKACEMFILELTLRSWIHTEENKRRILQKSDISAAISWTEVFDFLVDIIPRDELKEEGLGVTKATIPLMGSPAADAIPYYYVPRQQHPVGPPIGMIIGNQVDQETLYAAGQQPQPPLAFVHPWSQPESQPHQQIQ